MVCQIQQKPSWMSSKPDKLRYAAHLPLAAIGEDGVKAISNAHIALIGVGGLGCVAAQYLVSSGIGSLTLCDFDTVAESNLARQILYTQSDIGSLKVDKASETLRQLNPDTTIHTVNKRMTDEDMLTLFPSCNLVIDASDNYGTRLAVNRSCLTLKTPWIMASCIRMEAQIMLMQPDLPNQSCYRCAYGKAPDTLEDCPGAGIFAPVAGIAGSSAAHFALAYVAGMQAVMGLHLFDAVNWAWQTLNIKQDVNCEDCSQ
jgi:molybdopterin/thiamine biosynthesis adenylyltransferase